MATPMAKAGTSTKAPELAVRAFRSAAAWERWLEKRHGDSPGLWLQIAKKASGIASVDYPQALDVALCFGWIDGQRKPLDEPHYLQKFTPRRPGSLWSKVNRDKVLALIAAGRMRPAGHAAIAQAKSNGRWDAAYDSARTAEVPPDFAATLENNPAAARFFATLKSASRYAILFRLQTTRRPETRAAKIERFVAMLERGETFHGA